MEIHQGLVQKLFDLKAGTSAAGNAWRRQDFLFAFFERPTDLYTTKVVLGIMNDKIDQLNLQEGDTIEARFAVSAREYQGKWFNDVRTGEITIVKRVNGESSAPAAADPQTSQSNEQKEEKKEEKPPTAAFTMNDAKTDDLPF